jgi:nucleoside-diphosphate-sugar epimerase
MIVQTRMTDVTVLGAAGFIGSHLSAELRRRGYRVRAPQRDANLTGADLGTVFYCIGLTADFRSRPFDTVSAHVGKLAEVLRGCRFDSLVYLSSTRLYRGVEEGVEEQGFHVDPSNAEDLYNLSKALGESLGLHSGRAVRVARLSNVYGRDWGSSNFLSSIIRAALRDRVVTLQTAPESAKDYVHVGDVVDALIRIGARSTRRIYNVASGRNVSHRELLRRLQPLTRCEVRTPTGVPAVVLPRISIARAREEFGFSPVCILDELPGLIEAYAQHRKEWL